MFITCSYASDVRKVNNVTVSTVMATMYLSDLEIFPEPLDQTMLCQHFGSVPTHIHSTNSSGCHTTHPVWDMAGQGSPSFLTSESETGPRSNVSLEMSMKLSAPFASRSAKYQPPRQSLLTASFSGFSHGTQAFKNDDADTAVEYIRDHPPKHQVCNSVGRTCTSCT